MFEASHMFVTFSNFSILVNIQKFKDLKSKIFFTWFADLHKRSIEFFEWWEIIVQSSVSTVVLA